MRRRAGIAAAVLGALGLLAACSGAEDPSAGGPEALGAGEPDRSVVQAASPLPDAEVEQQILPYPFQGLPTYALDFDDVPVLRDGVAFGLSSGDGPLTFSAVSTEGVELWRTERPASCSGYALSEAGGDPIVVLTDTTTGEETLSDITASAYDLHTGDLVWGPVEVPGPWHGPGLVFAAGAPAAVMGETGARVALDPNTGQEVDAGQAETVGEFDGTILTARGDTLTATGSNEWEIPVADLTTAEVGVRVELFTPAGVSAPTGYALITVGGPESALIELATGEVLTTTATAAAWDAAAEVLVVTEGETLAGYTPQGPAWNRARAEGVGISASGGVLTYLRSDTSVQVVNSVTGEDAVGYEPETTRYAVPVAISADGAGVFDVDGFILTGTHPGE